MLTRTLPNTQEQKITSVESIEQSVDERGFYLYEWISPDELRMTIDRDYLQMVRWASIPLAIVTGIAGFIGFAGGIVGSIVAVLLVLFGFYGIVFLILIFRTLHRSMLYIESADIVITDNHYISGASVIEKQDRVKIEETFRKYESVFDEKFLGPSTLAEKKEHAKKALLDNLKEIFAGGGNIVSKLGRSRDAGGIILVLMIAGALYATMMGLVYFIGLFFLAIMGQIFAKGAHYYLLSKRHTEYTIQDLFSSIDQSAKLLETEKLNTISLLDEATQNAWKDNLTGKLNTSLELLGQISGKTTDTSIELRELLENSRYKDVFNFVKYGNWVKKQILEPIESILLLLSNNHAIIESTLSSLYSQIQTTSDPALRSPLSLQYDRLVIQKESFERVMSMFEGYREKLK